MTKYFKIYLLKISRFFRFWKFMMSRTIAVKICSWNLHSALLWVKPCNGLAILATLGMKYHCVIFNTPDMGNCSKLVIVLNFLL